MVNPLDLPPWLALPYFQSPVITTVNAPFGGSSAILLQPDPLRWMFMITLDASSGSVFISPKKTTQGGIQVNTTLQTVFTWPIYGPLVNAQWYVLGISGAVVVDVITISMIDWPTEDNVDRLSKLIGVPKRPRTKVSTAPGVGGKLGILDYWHRLIAKLTGQNIGG